MSVWRHLAALTTVLLALAWALAAHAPTSAVCSAPFGACPVIVIAGEQAGHSPDAPGLETPALIADPMRPERVWLAYTQLVTRSPIVSYGRDRLGLYTATRLARSDDGGATWRVDSELWRIPFFIDRDLQAMMIAFGTRAPSLAVVRGQGAPIWFAVRPRHRVESETAYMSARRPAASTIHVAKAQGETPVALTALPTIEVLASGARRVSSPTGADVDLQAIAPELSDCVMFMAPSVFA